MGFFSDLKEDLSQAVNELMPEEIPGDTPDGVPKEMPDDMPDGIPKDMPGDMTEGVPETLNDYFAADSTDRNGMTDWAEEPLEEAVISPDDAEGLTEDTSWPAEAAEEDAPAETGVPEDIDGIPEIEGTEDIFRMNEGEETVSVQEPVTEQTDAAAEEEETISVSGGEEEKKMDAQAQTQTQAQVNRVAVDETAVVTEGMTITGDIISEGSMELIGTVNGNLDILGKLNITGTIQGDSKAAEIFAEGARITGEVNSQGSVKIGQSSVVIGNIAASSAVIAGAVKGDIDVHGPVILDTTAIVMGNIKSKSVQINNGAVIEGLCSQCYADVNPTSFFEEFKKKK